MSFEIIVKMRNKETIKLRNNQKKILSVSDLKCQKAQQVKFEKVKKSKKISKIFQNFFLQFLEKDF